MKRSLRIAALALLASLMPFSLLLVPGSSAKYTNRFGFSFGEVGYQGAPPAASVPLNNASADTANANANAQRGFDLVYAANHLFVYKGTGWTYSAGTEQIMTIARAGYYAFVLRGGDGGTGRNNSTGWASAGGPGGLVMGYIYLDPSTTPALYISVASSGPGYKTGSSNGYAYFAGGQAGTRGGDGAVVPLYQQ